MKYCQGPSCHEHKTKDRIRGSKGNKHYETRRRTYLNYGDNFCSLMCQDDWFKNMEHEPLTTSVELLRLKEQVATVLGIKIISMTITLMVKVIASTTLPMIYLVNEQ